jgi:hypothetical protein
MPQSNKHVLNHRRHAVAKLYLEGWPQFKIAERVGVHQSQVSRDLKFLSQRWQESSMVNIDGIKAREMAKLDELERKYTRGWYRSIGVQKTEKTKENDDGTEVTIEKKELVGDPRFLDGILKCVAKREEILGYGAPSKQSIDLNMEKILEQAPEDVVDMLFNRIMEIQKDNE